MSAGDLVPAKLHVNNVIATAKVQPARRSLEAAKIDLRRLRKRCVEIPVELAVEQFFELGKLSACGSRHRAGECLVCLNRWDCVDFTRFGLSRTSCGSRREEHAPAGQIDFRVAVPLALQQRQLRNVALVALVALGLRVAPRRGERRTHRGTEPARRGRPAWGTTPISGVLPGARTCEAPSAALQSTQSAGEPSNRCRFSA